MADNTIDSLELKIESSADQAVRSLENLSAKLTTIKNTLGNTNVGFDLSGISKTSRRADLITTEKSLLEIHYIMLELLSQQKARKKCQY